MQMEYGILSACISVMADKSAQPEQRYCILQELEELRINNEFDCPLLSLTNNYHFVIPEIVFTTVSILHQCTSSCKFITKSSFLNFEREQISQSRLTFQHHLADRMFFLNLFCINQ